MTPIRASLTEQLEAAQRLIDAFDRRPDIADLRARFRSKLELVGTLNLADQAGLLHVTLQHGRTVVAGADIVAFRPPNPRRLEFLALQPLDLGTPLPSRPDVRLERLSDNVGRLTELDWLGPTRTAATPGGDLDLAVAQVRTALFYYH